MEKTCSRCGKELSFMDSFKYEGSTICKTCLDEESRKRESESKTRSAEAAAEVDINEQIRKQLRSGGIGSVIFGIIAVVMGASTMGDVPLNAGLFLIGLFLLLEGIWLLASPKLIGFKVDGIALGCLGIWNLIVTAHNISQDSGGAAFGVLGVMQIVWGVQSYKKYDKFKKELEEGPIEDAAVLSEVEAGQEREEILEAEDAREKPIDAGVCKYCAHFQTETNICSYFHFNVVQYPKKFEKKCNGKSFSMRGAS